MTWMLRPPLGGDGGHSEIGHSDTGDDGSVNGAMPGMAAPGMAMPGMATREQILQLEGLGGQAAETRFLELMIAHHRGGVEMAAAILERSDVNVVRDLAAGILSVQESEMALMERMLAERR